MAPPRDTRLLLELGRGGMGVVYLALATGPGDFRKLKVVKRLRPELADEPRARQMFLDEAKLAARLIHPNVVQTNEVGSDGTHDFIEMEYVEGQPLEAIARRAAASGAGGLPIADAIWILTQVLAGLHHAHELAGADGEPLRIVHRDVSPHNVMVTYDGAVKVLDFGVAKAIDSRDETSTGTVKGKVTYMAPEQAARRPVDRRADLFAVGVMLWEVVTGRRLWEGLGDFEIFTRLHEGEIPRARDARPDVSPELDAICARAMAPRAEDRFATAAELQAALEAYLDASGARVGQKSVAKRVQDLFVEKRARMRAEIDARVRDASTETRTVDVPPIRSTTASTPPPDADRTLRRWALGAAIVAVTAGAAFARVRHRPVVAQRAPAAAVAAECETNADCARAHGGQAWICRKGVLTCAPLETDRCKVLAGPGDAEDDRTLWLGAMYPLTGPRAEGGVVAERGVDLGRRDFAQIVHGVPSLDWNAAARPVGLVACDDATDAEGAARHLVDDVGVPAVMGFGSSQEVVDLATRVFLPKHVMVVATENQSPLVTAIPQPPGERRLVFRTTLSTAVYQTPVGLIVPEVIEPRLRAARVVGPREAMRVALVRSNSTAALSTAEHIFAHLRFNGKSAADNGDAYRQFVFPDLDHVEDVVAGVVAFAPHVVVFSGQELAGPVITPIERRWTAAKYRPYFVSTGSLMGDDLLRFVGTSADRRRRFFGVAPPSSTLDNARLTMRYNEVFARDPISPAASPAASYDGFYLLAYAAIAASGSGPPGATTGADLAATIERLVPPGEAVDVGPMDILRGVEALRTQGRLDLAGVMTTLDFDLEKGEPKGDLVITCFGVDARGAATDGVDSGLRYDAKSDALVGALRCP